MASINDLAAAATIASSAVALQSSPAEPPPAAPSPEPSPAAPPSPSAPPPTTPPPAPATQEEESLSSAPAAAPPAEPATVAAATATTATTSTPVQPTPPPPASAVLAAPQISPRDAVSAQFPVPPPPSVAPAAPGVASATPNGPEEGADDGGAPARRQKPVRGAFVVFEGMDRAGKTTQAKLLLQRCIEEGKEVKFMRFPDRTTPIGQMIDAYLRGQTEIEDHVIHLLFSANRWEALKTIQTTLAAGVSIICDRYYHSGIVYSAAKQNPALPLSWAKAPEVGLPRPDLVLFLDLDERVARERGGWGGEVYEKGEMQRRVRELFWGLSMGDLGPAGRERRAASAAPHPGAGPAPDGAGALAADPQGEFRQEKEDLHIIDADLPVEDLAEKVWARVQPRLETVERGDVGATVRTVH